MSRYGPRDASAVLVLIPGSPSGQGNFSLLAPELVARVPGLQVWSVDRRTNAFEDPTGFGQPDPDLALAYYTFLAPIGSGSFSPVADA